MLITQLATWTHVPKNSVANSSSSGTPADTVCIGGSSGPESLGLMPRPRSQGPMLEPKTPPQKITTIDLAGRSYAELIGRWDDNPNAGEPMEPNRVWTSGTLIGAMTRGEHLVASGVDRADAATREVLGCLQRGEESLTLDGGHRVAVHPDFRLDLQP